MTILLVMIVLGCLLGMRAGGRVRYIARLRLRRWPLVVLALVVQGTLSVIPHALRIPLLVLACAALAVWCASNLHVARLVPGMVVLGLGIVSNTLVIALNGGMPVSRAALADAGIPRDLDVARGHLDKHVAPLHPHLGFLGDFIPVPGIHEVMSVGDVVMLVGIFLIVRAATLTGVERNLATRADVASLGRTEVP